MNTPFSSEALAALLQGIRRHGDFYASGSAEIAPPNVTVQGVGMLSLPFQQSQLAALLAQAERAPFGRGAQTLIDIDVRRTWQVGADALSFGGRRWQSSLDVIVAGAAAGLGVTDAVRAELYKLLVYDTGSFFVEHRDTEKADGMFATLVLVLPSLYSGGELLIRHGDREVRLDLAGTEPGEAAFAAFYADCVHEVLPVTSGARLALVYNLIRDGATTVLTAPEQGPEVRAAAGMLRAWATAVDAGAVSAKLIYPLQHAYSQAELGFAALKNADASAAQVLSEAAAQADCEIHLALLDIEESGSAEYSGYGRRGYRSYYDDEEDENDAAAGEFEIGEIVDRSATLSCWRGRDGVTPPLGALSVTEEELCPPDVFDDVEADQVHFQEATGNAGASFDRAYRRAALVLWPRSHRMTVLGAATPGEGLPYLEHLVGAWLQAGAADDDAHERDACDLAEHLVRRWPQRYQHNGMHAARMLTSLAFLRNHRLIELYLEQVAAAGKFSGQEAESLARAILLLPPPRAALLVQAIVAANASFAAGGCADLLRLCVEIEDGSRDGSRAWLAPAMQRLVETLQGQTTDPAPTDGWRQPPPTDATAALRVLTALQTFDAPQLGARLVAYWLDACPLDAMLAPSALAAADASLRRFAPAVQLCVGVRARIEERVALPLAPPADWRRASGLSCDCRYCAQLALFLADPERPTWTLKAAETHRRHVAATIVRNQCDVDSVTVRQGSPHGLACTKNQASHDARCRQRTADLALLPQLAVQ